MLEIITRLWCELILEPFSLEHFVQSILTDMGEDSLSLSEADIIAGLTGGLVDKWDEIAFSCGDTLAYYSAMRGFDNGRMFDSEMFVRVMAVACLLGAAVRRGNTAWSFRFDFVLEIVYFHLDKGSPGIRVELFREICR